MRKNQKKGGSGTDSAHRLGGPGHPAGAGRFRESGRRRPDDALRREIYEILTSDPELEAREIGVEVEGGAVTLTGVVEHEDAKLLAEELVESIPGVREIHNRLEVGD